MSSESKVVKELMLELARWGCTCWRNETAGAWVGRTVYTKGTEVSLRDAKRIQAGLCVGSPDIVGYTSDGRFVGIEAKRPGGGRVSKEQERFIEVARANRCVVGVVRSVEELREILLQYGLTRVK